MGFPPSIALSLVFFHARESIIEDCTTGAILGQSMKARTIKLDRCPNVTLKRAVIRCESAFRVS